MDFEKMKAVDPKTVNIEDLIDISAVCIDPNASREERVCQFLEQIKNPYLYRCGNLVVKSVFASSDDTLEDRLKQYFEIVKEAKT